MRTLGSISARCTLTASRPSLPNGGGIQTSNTASTYTQSALPNPYPISFDSFNSQRLSSAWKFTSGQWTQKNGMLQQLNTSVSNTNEKAILTDQAYPADQTITAKIQVASWSPGDAARAGVGIYTDPKTGRGYELVFHGNNQVQFLDDNVAWGNAYTFNWQVGTWYWFQLTDQNGTLMGKVWQDGTPEPSSPMFQQSGWTDRTSGSPSLDGGATGSPPRFRVCLVRRGRGDRDGQSARSRSPSAATKV